MQRTHKLLIPAAALAAMVGTAQAAPLSFVQQDSFKSTVQDTGATVTATQGVTLNASSDILVVTLSSERSVRPITVTYNNQSLMEADDSGRTGIYYLLNPDTGAEHNLVVTFADNTSATSQTVNGYGIAYLTMSSGGDPIALNAANTASGSSDGTTVSLTTTVDDAFVVFSGFGNENSGSGHSSDAFTSAPGTLTEFDQGDIGSGLGGYAYNADVDTGTNTYGFTYTNDKAAYHVAAAAFVIVPEPGSLALLAAGGLLMIKRRRRD